MASPFAEAIMSNVLSSMSPDSEATRKAIQSFVEDQSVQVTLKKAEAIGQLQGLIADAEAKDANATVVTAYQKLLTKLSA